MLETYSLALSQFATLVRWRIYSRATPIYAAFSPHPFMRHSHHAHIFIVQQSSGDQR